MISHLVHVSTKRQLRLLKFLFSTFQMHNTYLQKKVTIIDSYTLITACTHRNMHTLGILPLIKTNLLYEIFSNESIKFNSTNLTVLSLKVVAMQRRNKFAELFTS